MQQIKNIKHLLQHIHIVNIYMKLKTILTLLVTSECEGTEEPGVFSSRSVTTSLLLTPLWRSLQKFTPRATNQITKST